MRESCRFIDGLQRSRGLYSVFEDWSMRFLPPNAASEMSGSARPPQLIACLSVVNSNAQDGVVDKDLYCAHEKSGSRV